MLASSSPPQSVTFSAGGEVVHRHGDDSVAHDPKYLVEHFVQNSQVQIYDWRKTDNVSVVSGDR